VVHVFVHHDRKIRQVLDDHFVGKPGGSDLFHFAHKGIESGKPSLGKFVPLVKLKSFNRFFSDAERGGYESHALFFLGKKYSNIFMF